MKKQLAAGVACASLAFGGVAVATSTEASAVIDTGGPRCRSILVQGTDGRLGAMSQCWGSSGWEQRATVTCGDGTVRAGKWTSTAGAQSRSWCPKGYNAWNPRYQLR
ncbi:hypothetical protein GCM10025872_37490 [Barrientosiimonas endolithica]|uniref:Uncharacterized protein n=1 Tax=Barrientosiimonas endolithica TaxID=1535208 RepID=A0ABM8HGF1_9MICO|nr:hypothetical protein GCM10025872_37490 [Barrientosiimonas endolithica]